ncbi:MAG: energy transducer TonB [Gammaproteobacteria bacterium]|nr:energy transducer TonB [Gammaproteobacteria bacterium]
MSAVYPEDGIIPRRGHINGWGVSLGFHGVVGGLVIAAVFALARPIEPPPFEWDVSLAAAEQVTSASPVPAQPPIPRSAPPPEVTQKALPRQTVPVVSSAAPVTNHADVPVPVQAPAPVQAVPAPVVAADPVPARVEPAPVAPAIPSPAANSSPDTGLLKDLLWRRVDTLKKYPVLARRNGWEGQVLLKVVLGGDGRLIRVEVQESSGHEALDQSALETVRAATPLKLENQSWSQVALLLPVVYRFAQ